jgi:hypothetical protein
MKFLSCAIFIYTKFKILSLNLFREFILYYKLNNHDILNDGRNQKIRILVDMFIIESIFILVWLYMYLPFINGHLILFGDLGISELNSNIFSQLSVTSPSYFNVFLIWLYHLNPNAVPLTWDYYLLLTPLLVPLGFYYLTYIMKLNRFASILATLFYSINPLMILFALSGLEYSGLFFLFPILLAYLIKYHSSDDSIDIVKAVIIAFFIFTFLGIDYLKFIIFIVGAIILTDVILSHNKINKVKHYVLGGILTLILLFPDLVSFVSSFLVYNHAAVTNPSTLTDLIGITKFEFASSNILTSLYALPYVANHLIINYEETFYSLIYLSIIVLSLTFIIKYRGHYKYLCYSLFIVLILLIIFQFGVYNGTFIFLYKRYDFIDLYNYPLFFYISQILIYAIFFVLLLDFVFNYFKKIRFKKYSQIISISISIICVVLVILSSLPVIQYENITTPNNVASDSVPSYVLELTKDLKPYYNDRVLVLPDNGSTLSYMDMAISYYDIYGLPYGYQNFPALFPNLTEYSRLGHAFEGQNSSQVNKILTSLDIQVVVVLNTLNDNQISYQGTAINGGGLIFANIMNQTGSYNNYVWNQNFAIYKLNPYSISSESQKIPYSTYDLTYRETADPVVTSDYSYESFPIQITTNFTKMGNYDQFIVINKSEIASINNNFSNIMFYYNNSKPIPAYISCINNDQAGIYLNMSEEANQTIYLRVYPYNVNKMEDNNFIGEAPELSGMGSNKLPDYIEYSTAIVGVYGYGYDGNVFTLNFTFNPQYFTKYENKNLTNMEFFTSNGRILEAHMDGNFTNNSKSATVTISFPNGVGYFQKLHDIGNDYNVFYLGFGAKNLNLNGTNANITFFPESDKTALDINYFPYAVKDFGNYGEFDNGQFVFPFYTSYSGYAFANAWAFDIYVNGYGFLSSGDYGPDSYFYYSLASVLSGQEAVSNSYIIDGQTASPLLISSDNDSALMGSVNPNDITTFINQTVQQHSTDLGFGSNNSNVSIFKNYNNSLSYTFKQYGPNILEPNFASYKIMFNGSATLFYINNTLELTYNYTATPNAILSNIWNGQMVTYDSYIINLPKRDSNPVIYLGQPTIFQAYLNGEKLLNPSYSNTTVTFSYFPSSNMPAKWEINNVSFTGYSLLYKFSKAGNYTIIVKFNDKNSSIQENIIGKPESMKPIELNFTSAGIHSIYTSALLKSNISAWYVNGQMVAVNASFLKYNFQYNGYYNVQVFSISSYGNYNVTYIVHIINKTDLGAKNMALLFYNILVPLLALAYIVSSRFRKAVNSRIVKIIHFLHI